MNDTGNIFFEKEVKRNTDRGRVGRYWHERFYPGERDKTESRRTDEGSIEIVLEFHHKRMKD